MILKFGKHKGKSINNLMNEGEYSYVVWLNDNVSSVIVEKKTYNYCKNKLFLDKITNEAIMESEHGDWGCRN